MGRVEDQMAQGRVRIKERQSQSVPFSAPKQKAAPPESTYEPHRLAEAFPPIDGAEFEELVADIRKNGLINPVTMYQGKVLDGRNRVRACQIAGVKIERVPWMGECGTPEAFVIARNVVRRHLTADQRAVLGVGMLADAKKAATERMAAGGGDKKAGKADTPYPVDGKGQSRDQVGEVLGVSGKKIEAAGKLVELDPGLAEQVARGEKKLTEALREAVAEQVPQPVALKKKAAKRREARAKCPHCGRPMP